MRRSKRSLSPNGAERYEKYYRKKSLSPTGAERYYRKKSLSPTGAKRYDNRIKSKLIDFKVKISEKLVSPIQILNLTDKMDELINQTREVFYLGNPKKILKQINEIINNLSKPNEQSIIILSEILKEPLNITQCLLYYSMLKIDLSNEIYDYFINQQSKISSTSLVEVELDLIFQTRKLRENFAKVLSPIRKKIVNLIRQKSNQKYENEQLKAEVEAINELSVFISAGSDELLELFNSLNL